MFAAMLVTVSIVALIEFAIYYWRAVVASAATQPISESVRAAAGLDGRALRAGDFSTFADLHEITPTLQERIRGFGLVNAYYHLMSAVGQLSRPLDRKSTRLNSSHVRISYAVFCLKKKTSYS